jgi:hypothetical protein
VVSSLILLVAMIGAISICDSIFITFLLAKATIMMSFFCFKIVLAHGQNFQYSRHALEILHTNLFIYSYRSKYEMLFSPLCEPLLQITHKTPLFLKLKIYENTCFQSQWRLHDLNGPNYIFQWNKCGTILLCPTIQFKRLVMYSYYIHLRDITHAKSVVNHPHQVYLYFWTNLKCL